MRSIKLQNYKRPKNQHTTLVAHTPEEFLFDVRKLQSHITSISKDHANEQFFYRGEDQKYNSPNVASIFRYNCNESKLYHSYMSRFNFFNNLGNFSKLTDMEHYGLPTCLLDISKEPLVALYFACCNTYGLGTQIGDKSIHNQLRDYYNCDKDDKFKDNKYCGVVYVISPDENDVVYNNNYSDTAEILATFALLKKSTQQNIYRDIRKFNKKFSKYIDIYNVFYHFFKNHEIQDNYKMRIIRKLIILSKKNCYDFQQCSYIFREINRCYNELMFHSYEMLNFAHKIRQDIADYDPMLDISQFLTPKIIQPVFNNKRIRAQKGLFIFENYLSYDNKFNGKNVKKDIRDRMKHISNNIFLNFNVHSILIPNEYKKKILSELNNRYRINSSVLFPNLSNVASFLRSGLRPKSLF